MFKKYDEFEGIFNFFNLLKFTEIFFNKTERSICLRRRTNKKQSKLVISQILQTFEKFDVHYSKPIWKKINCKFQIEVKNNFSLLALSRGIFRIKFLSAN